MTFTFKDSDGVECRLLVSFYNSAESRIRERPVTLDDLIRALGLATGSDGPTDESLHRIYLDANGDRYAGFRALFAAGFASRQAEIDRLTAENARLERAALGSEFNRDTERLRIDELSKKLLAAELELEASKLRVAQLEGELNEALQELRKRDDRG